MKAKVRTRVRPGEDRSGVAQGQLTSDGPVHHRDISDEEWSVRAENAIRLLESWYDGDEEEARDQRETWEFLKKALDEDRLSNRKLFP